MLSLNNVSVNFGGVKALTDVTFNVPANKITALIGPNGAGKTTLFNSITGFIPHFTGDIQFENNKLNGKLPHEIFQLGISRTFQNLNLINELTLRENMLLGVIGKEKPAIFSSFFRLNKGYWKRVEERIDDVLYLTGIKKWEKHKPDSVPYGVLKNLEMARALISNPKLLLLDEPAAGLNNKERENIAEIIAQLKDKGFTVLMVEHDMGFVSHLSDYVVCLNFGQVIAKGTFGEIRNNKDVIKAYLGDEDA
ncbi:ABC transporter ATP-binding protein [Deferribacteraceae bacterium V6Fe1]|nr:ABC transporter ATP-binding protein [Deferribacteraceae bacterium V6Fe1]